MTLNVIRLCMQTYQDRVVMCTLVLFIEIWVGWINCLINGGSLSMQLKQ